MLLPSKDRVLDPSVLLCSLRVINVTGAGYADCSGLYTISNLTSIWDSKRIVFERIAGGWRPMDKRSMETPSPEIFIRTL